jgi:hypothetical protein
MTTATGGASCAGRLATVTAEQANAQQPRFYAAEDGSLFDAGYFPYLQGSTAIDDSRSGGKEVL